MSKTVEEAAYEWLNNTFPSDVLEFDDGDMHASFIAGAAHGRAEGAAEEREAVLAMVKEVASAQVGGWHDAACNQIAARIRQRGER